MSTPKPGLLWEYIHEEGEPEETLGMYRRMACWVAEVEAIKNRKTALVGHRCNPEGYCVYWPSSEWNFDPTLTPLYEIDARGNITHLEHHGFVRTPVHALTDIP